MHAEKLLFFNIYPNPLEWLL